MLSAFGCGAFLNPAARVAAIYREELSKRATRFDVIAFAIFNAGYGPNNFEPFRVVFEDWPEGEPTGMQPSSKVPRGGDRALREEEEHVLKT